MPHPKDPIELAHDVHRSLPPVARWSAACHHHKPDDEGPTLRPTKRVAANTHRRPAGRPTHVITRRHGVHIAWPRRAVPCRGASTNLPQSTAARPQPRSAPNLRVYKRPRTYTASTVRCIVSSPAADLPQNTCLPEVSFPLSLKERARRRRDKPRKEALLPSDPLVLCSRKHLSLR